MTGTDLLPTGDFPKPPSRRRSKYKSQKAEMKKIGTEAAAIAYVQMESGEYKYPDGARRQFEDDGSPCINKRELMRRAGYSPGSLDHFDEYVGKDDEFWELVELHRLRRTDPMFRVEQENLLWVALGGESLRNLYERVFYAPHSLSPEQHIKIVKLILDAGITLKKMGGDGDEGKTAGLIGSLSPEKRKKVMDGYETSLRKELEELESIKKAHRAVDRREEDHE